MASSQIITIAIVLGIFSNNFFTLNALAEEAPPTFGQPTYPSSGSTRNRSDVMGGESSASEASNVEGLTIPSKKPPNRQEEQEKKDESFKRGPYNQEGEYQHLSPDE